jgi:hypothetical protein
MFEVSKTVTRSPISRIVLRGLISFPTWCFAAAAYGQQSSATPSAQSTTVTVISGVLNPPTLTDQPVNPCSAYSIDSKTTVTIWYQTYFNPYTQKIQIVPACTPPECKESDAAKKPAAGTSAATITGDVSIAGTDTTISGAGIKIKGVAGSVKGVVDQAVGGITIDSKAQGAQGNAGSANQETASITNGQIDIEKGGVVTIEGGVPSLSNGVVTITGGSVTIAKPTDITINGATVQITGGGSSSTASSTVVTDATLEVKNASLTITGGEVSATGTIDFSKSPIKITGGQASILGGTATVKGDKCKVTAGKITNTPAKQNATPTPAAGQNPPPPQQDVAQDMNAPGATPQPESFKILWNPAAGAVPASQIDVEIRVSFRGREGIYTVSQVKLDGNSYTVSIKKLADEVMKQILLTGCSDPCGSIYLDCDAAVNVYPYVSTPAGGAKGQAGIQWQKATTAIATMNRLPIQIKPKPFGSKL